jgi:hypothetical protein
MRAASAGGSLSKSSPEPQTDRKSRAAPAVARGDHRPHPAQRLGIGALSGPSGAAANRTGSISVREATSSGASMAMPQGHRRAEAVADQMHRPLRQVRARAPSPDRGNRGPVALGPAPCPTMSGATRWKRSDRCRANRFHAPPWASVQCRRKTGGAASSGPRRCRPSAQSCPTGAGPGPRSGPDPRTSRFRRRCRRALRRPRRSRRPRGCGVLLGPRQHAHPGKPGIEPGLLQAGADLVILGDVAHVAPDGAGEGMHQLAQIAAARPWPPR